MIELLKDPRLFPMLMIGLSVASAVKYALGRSLGHTVYWLCAAGLTFAVTFLMGGK
jgi:hypothetical protein